MRRNKIIILILMFAIAVLMSCQIIPSSVPVNNTNIDNKTNSSNSYKIAEGGSDTDNPGPVPTKTPLPGPSLLERIPEILTGTISVPNTNITMGKGLPSISKANRFGRVELTYGTMPDGQEGITGGRLIFNYNHYETIDDEQFASKSVSMDLNLRIPLVRDYESKDIIKLKSDSIDNYPGFYDTYPDYYKREFATRLQVYSSGGCTRVTKDSYFNQSVSAELSILVNGRAEGTISSISAGSSTGTFSNGSGGSGACSPYLELPTPGLSGNVIFDLNIAEFDPQLEIVVKNPTGENAAAIISPINQDKKYDRAEFRVTAFPEERWRLIVEGEINGQVRQWRQPGDGTRDQPITDEQAESIQSGDGKKGKAIPWYGKTNDAINSKDDTYFDDGNYVVKLIRTNGYTEFTGGGQIMVDNTPPEVFVDPVSINGESANITGRVIDHIPGDVGTFGAGLDEDSFPNKLSSDERNIDFTEKASNNNQNYKGKLTLVSDNEYLEDIPQEALKLFVIGSLEEKLTDRVANTVTCNRICQQAINNYIFNSNININNFIDKDKEFNFVDLEKLTDYSKNLALDSNAFMIASLGGTTPEEIQTEIEQIKKSNKAAENSAKKIKKSTSKNIKKELGNALETVVYARKMLKSSNTLLETRGIAFDNVIDLPKIPTTQPKIRPFIGPPTPIYTVRIVGLSGLALWAFNMLDDISFFEESGKKIDILAKEYEEAVEKSQKLKTQTIECQPEVVEAAELILSAIRKEIDDFLDSLLDELEKGLKSGPNPSLVDASIKALREKIKAFSEQTEARLISTLDSVCPCRKESEKLKSYSTSSFSIKVSLPAPSNGEIICRVCNSENPPRLKEYLEATNDIKINVEANYYKPEILGEKTIGFAIENNTGNCYYAVSTKPDRIFTNPIALTINGISKACNPATTPYDETKQIDKFIKTIAKGFIDKYHVEKKLLRHISARNGGNMPPNVTIFTDRKTCKNCNKMFEALLETEFRTNISGNINGIFGTGKGLSEYIPKKSNGFYSGLTCN